MSKKRLSISQQIYESAYSKLQQKENNVSRRNYRYVVKRFISWCRENHNCKSFHECKNYIQEYIDSFNNKLTPSTIHTYASALCFVWEVPLRDISKPKRIAAEFIRNRNELENPRSSQCLNNPQFREIVEFQRRTGIRKSELKRLLASDFYEDKFGFHIVVRRGKGGKRQLQRILPEDVEYIKKVFAGKEPDEPLFTAEHFRNELPYHKLRAQHAKRCYEWLQEKLREDPGFAKKIEEEIREGWKNNKTKDGRVRPFPEHQIHGVYVIRGNNRKLRKNGDFCFDKLCCAWVSMYALSHYRLNVTIQNYLL